MKNWRRGGGLILHKFFFVVHKVFWLLDLPVQKGVTLEHEKKGEPDSTPKTLEKPDELEDAGTSTNKKTSS